MSREYTREEVQKLFLAHIRGLIDYWSYRTYREDTRGKLEGLAHSMLATIDGCSISIPCFILAPYPHEEDEDYRKGKGENYFAYNDSDKVKCDIGGSLHEQLWNTEPIYPFTFINKKEE